jgi:hypothetical protein
MSQIKLDLKRFKHVKSDGKTTTLQHPDGHTITMAHASLSPEAQAQLSQLAKAAQTSANTDELKHKGMYGHGGGVHKNWPQSNPSGSGMGQKGVHREYDQRGESMARFNHPEDAKKFKQGSVDEHNKVIGELRSMSNPKLKGLAEGGDVEADHEEQMQQRTAAMSKMHSKHGKAAESMPEYQRHAMMSSHHARKAGNPKLEESKKTPPEYAEGGEVDQTEQMIRHHRDMIMNDREMMAQGGNAGEQRKAIFGSNSAPKKGSEMQEKHMEHIKRFAKQFLGLELKPSGGKINPKTGERRDENAEVGVDKPDWRSGQLESQANPDAMVHELAHLMLLPRGIGLKEGQGHMDKQYADVQKKYGYMKQKQSAGEVQPMGAEQLIRRYLGLPANRNSVPVENNDPEMPLRTSVEDPTEVIGTRIKSGKSKGGEDKWVDLIRQSRFLHPENRQRIEDVLSGKLKFHHEHGWLDNPEHMGAKVEQYKNQPGKKPKMAVGGMVPDQAAYAEGGDVEADHQCEGAKFCMHCGGAMQHYDDGGNVSAEDRAKLMSWDTSGQPDVKPDQGFDTMATVMPGGHPDMPSPMGRGVFIPADATAPSDTYQASAPNSQGEFNVSTPSDFGAPTMDKMNPAAPVNPMDQPAPTFNPPSANAPQAPGFKENPQLDQAYAIPKAPTQSDFDSIKAGYANERQKEAIEWANDLHNQHITPKTYSSLFDDKSVPSKISSIFALMLGGMGAGAAGGTNPAMDMMDKMIQNDLEAQKQSKANAQNFLRLSQEHEYQKAQQKLMATQGGVNQAQAGLLRKQTDAIAFPMAQAKAYQVTLQSAIDYAKTLPQGSPQWQKAQQHIAMMAQAVQGKTMDLNNEAAAREALLDMQSGTGDNPESSFQKQQTMLRLNGQADLANINEQHHIAGIPGHSSGTIDPAIRKELASMNLVHQKGTDILGMIKNSSPMDLNNPLSPVRKQLIQKVDEFKNFYNGSIEGGALTQGRLGWYDEQFKKNPGSILSKILQEPARFEEAVNSNAMRLDQLLSGPGGLGFPPGSVRGFTGKTGQQPQMQQRSGPPGTRPVMIGGQLYHIKI